MVKDDVTIVTKLGWSSNSSRNKFAFFLYDPTNHPTQGKFINEMQLANNKYSEKSKQP